MVCPAFADSISEGDIRWEKAVGDSVAEDEVGKVMFKAIMFLVKISLNYFLQEACLTTCPGAV